MKSPDFVNLFAFRYSKVFVKVFLLITNSIILITLTAKVITLIQHPKVLDLFDSVTTFKFSNVLILGGIAEITLLTILLSPTKLHTKVFSVLYFSLMIGAYRIVSHMAGQAWCPCLGSFASWASMSQGQVNGVLNAIAICLVTGSIVSVLMLALSSSVRNKH